MYIPLTFSDDRRLASKRLPYLYGPIVTPILCSNEREHRTIVMTLNTERSSCWNLYDRPQSAAIVPVLRYIFMKCIRLKINAAAVIGRAVDEQRGNCEI